MTLTSLRPRSPSAAPRLAAHAALPAQWTRRGRINASADLTLDPPAARDAAAASIDRTAVSDTARLLPVVLAVAALMIVAPRAAHAQTYDGRASGVQGQVSLTGPLVTIPPTPAVTLPPGGGTAQNTLANINAADPALGAFLGSGTVTVRTSSDTDSTGAPIPLNSGIFSRASVENLNLGGGGLPALVSGSALSVSCQSGPSGLNGTMEATDLTLLGVPAGVPAPNAPPLIVEVAGIQVGTLALNRQTTTSSPGATSLTVTGIHLQLLTIPLVLQGVNLELLKATCSSAGSSLSAISPASGPVTGGNLVTIAGTDFGSDPAQVQVSIGGRLAPVTAISPSGVTVIAPPAPAPAVVNVTVTTPSGTTPPLAYTYAAVPTLTSITPASSATTGGQSVTLTGSGFGSSIDDVSVAFGGVSATITGVSPTEIVATVPASPGGVAGAVDVIVTAPGGPTRSRPFVYTDGATLESVTPAEGPASGGTVLTITGSGFAAGAIVTLDGVPATGVTVQSPTTIIATTPPGSAGAAAVVVTSGGISSTGPYAYISEPTISSLTPVSGNGGEVLTGTGTDLQPGATATICGQTVGTAVTSPTQILIVAPPCAGGGSQAVTITNPDGGAVSAPAFTYVEDADGIPSISAVTPSAGPTTGGTPVTITGGDFAPGATVTFDGVPATDVIVVDPQTITATAPPHAAGVVGVTVTTGGGGFTLAGAFTYGDALPAACVTQFGLDPNDVSGDPDGDGLSNLTECSAAVPSHPLGFFTRYLAEGTDNSFFDLRMALFNPGTTPATVLLQFQQPGGGVFTHVLTLAAHQRLTLVPATIDGFPFTEFSTVIESNVEIVVDRRMSWIAPDDLGSHAETAVALQSTTWYLAEGSTSNPFSLFYLLQNPHPTETTATIRYLLPFGLPPLSKTYQLAPYSRTTLPIDAELPELAGTDVSGVVEASQPIVVERAMYMDQPGQPFAGGHDSAGVTAPATEWFLAEGATGPFFEMFVLLANPNPTGATVRVDYLLLDGGVVTKDYEVPANGRVTIYVDEEEFPAGSGNKLLANVAVSARIRSTNNVPIVVERAMWWPQPAWYEGHNSAGTTSTGRLWALAEGEVGGADAHETYVLIANVSERVGEATVTLYFEDGTSASRVYPLQASSRLTIQTTVDFPEADGKRFATIIESSGSNPVDIVVERAMYSSAGGVTWGSGSNAVATRLSQPPD